MGKYLAAEHEQRKHKTVGQKRQLCHHSKLCGKQVQRRYGACHDQVPVVPQMFQPPQVGSIGGYHGREEEHGIKQGVLGPQAIPAVGEDLKILQIIESAVGGRKNGQHKEHCPDGGCVEFAVLRKNTAFQHGFIPPITIYLEPDMAASHIPFQLVPKLQ